MTLGVDYYDIVSLLFFFVGGWSSAPVTRESQEAKNQQEKDR